MKRWGPWESSFSLLILVGLLMPLLLFGSPASAANPLQEAGLEVVASGLDNPRGINFGPDGAMYVAEAGRGGDGPCMPGPEGEDVCFGASGAVTRVMGGQQARIATGLPSLAEMDGSGAAGPHDVVVRGDDVFVIVGLGADPAVRTEAGLPDPAGDFGKLVRVLDTDEWETVVDIAAYEASANPHDEALDSNPYALLALEDGFIVVDAGGNDLLRVDARNNISTIAVFANRLTDAPPFLGLPSGAQIPMQSVPTSVAISPDGAYYVGELTGFPFTMDAARVYRVAKGQNPVVFVSGFTNIVDIALDDDKNLWVLEIAANSLLSEQPAGALTRVSPGGEQETVVSEGLIMPTAVAIGPDNNVYISNCGVCAGGGQVLRMANIPPPPGVPIPPSVGDSTLAPALGAMAGALGLGLIAAGGFLLRRRHRANNV